MSPLLKPACGPHSPATQTRPHQADAPPACGLRPTGRAVFLALLALAALVLTATGMKSGATDCGWRDLAAALWDSTGDADLRYFVLYLRLPRVAAALTVGASLAVTGVVLQNVLNNPLASSFTLGLSQGAAFGASFVMIALATAGGLAGLSLVALGALAGALARRALRAGLQPGSQHDGPGADPGGRGPFLFFRRGHHVPAVFCLG